MSGRHTNLALFAVVGLALLTGTIAFGLGAQPWAEVVVIVHGLLGLCLLVLAHPKSRVIRRGWAVRRGDRWVSVALGVTAVVTVGSGLAHTVTWQPFAGVLSSMQVHVPAAITTGVLIVWHALHRPARPRATDASRRSFLEAGGVLGLGGLGWLVWNRTGADGGRRFTGSHETGSGDPAAMPVVQWFLDDVPSIDAATWRVDIGGRSLGLADLAAFDDRVVATVDCTNGWYAEQEWAGARLDRLLAADDPEARSILVRSVTGYTRRYPLRDLDRLWIATSVAGEPLSAGHGAPARLVAPGRRGFWWVKWLTDVRLDDRAPWLQPPFPLR